ncbi:MAG TPA: hypothetical protein PK511_14230 [Chitinophagales bacterium]|nr:hypothetical protein [Cyclobacteriaceae bacterium]HMY34614.1 hypothetical protein [bacterium]HMY95685.1 hypothetical protein [Cyclobacteriaceae bacterium]HNH32147.1 hypothetical protein [bacterium]HNI55680.1 hypothetical protein [Chitinophagales bacterium]
MTIAFCTYVSDKYYHSFGADKLLASAKYFHPDIPFFVFGDKEIAKFPLPVESLHPFMMNKLMAKFDIVVHIDADSIICGDITPVFEALETADVVCVRNNNDYGKAGCDKALSQQNRDINIYVNAGFVATKSKEFVVDWMHNNLLFAELTPFGSQSVLNTIIDKYHWKLIDGIDDDCYYGVSCLHGENSHWESWQRIQVDENGNLYLENYERAKTVKVLHHAGGFSPDKLGLYLFNDETRNRLTEICYGKKIGD